MNNFVYIQKQIKFDPIFYFQLINLCLIKVTSKTDSQTSNDSENTERPNKNPTPKRKAEVADLNLI